MARPMHFSLLSSINYVVDISCPVDKRSNIYTLSIICFIGRYDSH